MAASEDDKVVLFVDGTDDEHKGIKLRCFYEAEPNRILEVCVCDCISVNQWIPLVYRNTGYVA